MQGTNGHVPSDETLCGTVLTTRTSSSLTRRPRQRTLRTSTRNIDATRHRQRVTHRMQGVLERSARDACACALAFTHGCTTSAWFEDTDSDTGCSADVPATRQPNHRTTITRVINMMKNTPNQTAHLAHTHPRARTSESALRPTYTPRSLHTPTASTHVRRQRHMDDSDRSRAANPQKHSTECDEHAPTRTSDIQPVGDSMTRRSGSLGNSTG